MWRLVISSVGLAKEDLTRGNGDKISFEVTTLLWVQGYT